MDSTIGPVIISYDVNTGHTQVKDAMKQKGYRDVWTNFEGKRYQLPNTTLRHESKSSGQALGDLRVVCSGLRVTLEKAVAVRATDFVGYNQ